MEPVSTVRDGFFGRLRRRGMSRSVKRTEDFRRIEAIPRRTTYEDYSALLTEWLKTPAGTWSLRREQAWALSELADKRGLFAILEPGAGKTLITALAPVVVEAKRPLLLVPANLRSKTLDLDLPTLREHWQLPEHIRVLSYEELSRVKAADILDRGQFDLVIADECHRLRHKSAGVTRRVLRYFEERPATMFVGLSGSITKRSLRDYAHLLQLALRAGSPLPHRWSDLEDWADCIDENVPDDVRPDPGALKVFCEAGDTVRQGYRRRLIYTAGIVTTQAPTVDAALNVFQAQVTVPDSVRQAFLLLRSSWEVGDEDRGKETISTALEFNRHAKELALGFFYRWRWPVVDQATRSVQGHLPKCKPDCVTDHVWVNARRAWRQFVRRTIKASGTLAVGGRHYDTELQVARGCLAGALTCDEYDSWRAVRKRTTPQTEAVWVSDYAIDFALEWLASNEKGIVWCEHQAVLERLRERGATCYGAGQNDIVHAKESCVASIAAHGTGKNLQAFHRNLFLSFPMSGASAEQVISRTHRSGQSEDEVECEVLLPCLESWRSFEQARRDAAYIEATTGQRQKLCMATVVVTPESEVARLALAQDPLWTKELLIER